MLLAYRVLSGSEMDCFLLVTLRSNVVWRFCPTPMYQNNASDLARRSLNQQILLYFTFLFGNLTGLARYLMHYFDARTHHHNIMSQFHHQEQSCFRCVENTEDY